MKVSLAIAALLGAASAESLIRLRKVTPVSDEGLLQTSEAVVIMQRKHSDEVANGDPDDDKEVEDEKDGADDVVQDFGFGAGTSHHLWVQTNADVKKYSDWVANADAADDKEIEDEYDPNDPIVQDIGFSNHVHFRNMDGETNAENVDLQISARNMELLYKYSDWVANADEADDKEIEDEYDPNDPIVQDIGFSNHVHFRNMDGDTNAETTN